MAKHKYLKRAQEILKPHYHTVFRDDNALELSLNKKSLPFAFLIVEDAHPNTLLFSLALDFQEPVIAADLAITLMHIANVQIIDTFFIAGDKAVYWGEDAVERYVMENNPQLMQDIQPLTDTKH